MRNAEITRKTAETDIRLALCLDGTGKSDCQTGCGFLDHMLTLFAKHARFDLSVSCQGDTYVDDHHTVEDVGICLGKAFSEAIGEKRGIARYGDALVPMDEALILSAVDISGRGALFYALSVTAEKVGTFDTELCEEFWNAFARDAGVTLHLRMLAGQNAHHILEGVFKSAAQSLKKAVLTDAAAAGEIPSTKGVIA